MNSKLHSEDWQLRCVQTNQRLSHLFKSNLWSDCKFVVGDEGETVCVCAHKFVLAMSSPVFEAMFFGGMAEGDAPIAVTDVQPETFKCLLEYLYTDKVYIRSFSDAGAVYYAAKKYMVTYLQQRCVAYMTQKLAHANALYAYEFATLFDEKELLQAAMRKIQRGTKEVLKETNYEDIQLSTLLMVVKLDRLEIDSELDLFLALEKYAEASGVKDLKRSSGTCEDAKRIKLDESQKSESGTKDENDKEAEEAKEVTKSETDVEEIISRIRTAVSSIRFLTLTLAQTAVAAQSVLLTVDEALALLVRVAGGTADLPATICGSLERREPVIPAQIPDAKSVGTTYEAVQMFSVYNFKTRKRAVGSPEFYTDRLKWSIRAVPGTEKRIDDGIEQKVLGVKVSCELDGIDNEMWSCDAHVSIELVARNRQNLKASFNHTYNSASSEFGYTRLVWWNDIMDYLVSNTLTIQVKVIASRITY